MQNIMRFSRISASEIQDNLRHFWWGGGLGSCKIVGRIDNVSGRSHL